MWCNISLLLVIKRQDSKKLKTEISISNLWQKSFWGRCWVLLRDWWLVTFQEDLKCHNIINLLIPTLYKPIKLAQEFLMTGSKTISLRIIEAQLISNPFPKKMLRRFKIQLDFFLFCFQVWSGYNRNILENLTMARLLRVTCAGVVTMGRSLTMEGGEEGRRGRGQHYNMESYNAVGLYN